MDKKLEKTLKEILKESIFEEYSLEEIIRRVVLGLSEFIDFKKLLKYNQTLIEEIDEKVLIHFCEGEAPETEVIDCEGYSLAFDDSNEKEVSAMCQVAYVVTNLIGKGGDKYSAFRFSCGLEPNSDIEHEKLTKIVDEKTRDKLYDAGYEIIKRPARD